MDTTVISIDEVKSLCLAALQRKGALPHEADIVFDDYLDAELRGRASHGFSSFSHTRARTLYPSIPVLSSLLRETVTVVM